MNMISINGPVSAHYYELDDKKIVLLGDIHFEKNKICDKDAINIQDYIEKLTKNKNIQYDIFIEDMIDFKKSHDDMFTHSGFKKDSYEHVPFNDFLSMVRKKGRELYKKHSNVRIHFIDFRYLPEFIQMTVHIYQNITNIITVLHKYHHASNNKIKKIKYSDFIKIIKIYNVYGFIHSMLSTMIEGKYIINKFEVPKIKIIRKELDKLKSKNNEWYDVLRKYVRGIIEYMSELDAIGYKSEYVYLISYNNENPSVYVYDDNNYLNLLSAIRHSISSFQEIYGVARMLSRPYAKNNIYYAGNWHILFMTNIMKDLKAEKIFSVDNFTGGKEDYRCLHVPDFEQFFN